jgi:ABC-type transport system involved in multi-copper enzyme maturation permease subunit
MRVLLIARGVIMELVRKKDFYVLLVMLLFTMAALASQTFFELKGITRYVKDIGFTLITIFSAVICVTVSARQIPQEIERRTIYPLLAKPVSRYTVVCGKFLGSVMAAAAAFTSFYAVYIAFYFLSGSTGQGVLLAQTYLFGVLFLCLVSAMSVFFSSFMTVSANVTLCLLIYYAVSSFSGEFRDAVLYSKGAYSYFMGTVYYLIPHFDLYDLRVRLTQSWDALPAWAVAAVAVYTAVYSSTLIYFSGRIFGRKQL